MQSYASIPASQSIASSLALLLNNDQSSITNNSGTAFPASNLLVGMTCFRSDLNQLYQLTAITPSATWALICDFNKTSVTLQDGGKFHADVWAGDPASAVDTDARTLGSNYRIGVARNSASYTPYMVIANSALQLASPPASDYTALGAINFRWASTTSDALAGQTAADIDAFANADGSGAIGLFGRGPTGSIVSRILVNGNGGVTVGTTGNHNDGSTPFAVNPAGTSWAAINAPTARIIDALSGTGGGLSIESYQPTLQFIDWSSSAKNSRMTQNAGQINFANDPGDNSGVYNAAGFIIHPDGYISVGAGCSVSSNATIYMNGKQVGTGTTQYGVYYTGEFNESTTSYAGAFTSLPKLKAATFTMATLYGYWAAAPSIGSGATLTNYYGHVTDDFSGATLNAGFRSRMTAGTGKWGLYFDGTATNYLNGQVQIGSTTDYANGKVQIATPAAGGHGLAVVRNGQSLQYLAIGTNTGLDTSAPNDHKIVGYSPATAAKPIYIHATTDEAGTVPTNGTVGINFKLLNGTFGRFWQSGNFGLGYGLVDDSVNALQVAGGSKFTGPVSTVQLATPAAPTGTASTTGGSLAAGTWYARIVAVDSAGGTTAVGTQSAGVATTGTTSSIAWTWTAIAGAVSYRIYYGTVSGGQAAYYTSSTNSFTLTASSGTAGSPPTLNSTGAAYFAGSAYISTGALGATLWVNSNAATYRGVFFQTAGQNRWSHGANQNAESGSNAGSDYSIDRYTDAGAWLNAPLLISRNSGLVTLANGLSITAGDVITNNTQWFKGGAIELGSLVTTMTPFIDFHSSGTGNDFDARLITTGGNASYGFGTLQALAAQFQVSNPNSSLVGIMLNAAGYNPVIRANSSLSAIECINAANTAVNFTISDGGYMTARNGFYSQIGGGLATGAFRTTSDIGGAFVDWNNGRTYGMQIDAPNANSAYGGMRWTRWGARHIAAIDAYENGTSGVPEIVFQIDGQINTFVFNRTDILRGAGGYFWHTTNLPNPAQTTGATFSGTCYFNGGTNGSYSATFGYLNNGGASVFSSGSGSWPISFIASNTCVASQWFAVSDRRLKTEIEDIDEAEAIQFVQQVAPKRYLKEGIRERGYLAQDVGKSMRGKGSELITLTEREDLEEEIDEDGFVSPAGHALNVSHDQIIPIHGAVLRNILRRLASLEAQLAKAA